MTDAAAGEVATTIRPLAPADLTAFVDLNRRNRADLARTGPPRPPDFYEASSLAQHFEKLLAQCAQNARQYWLIEVDGTVAGDIGLNSVARGHVLSANVGYMVDHEFRGRGVATAALRLVIRESFDGLRLHRLDAGALTTNLASQKVLEKAGFRRVGVNERLLFVDGAWRDHVLFELVGADFVPAME